MHDRSTALAPALAIAGVVLAGAGGCVEFKGWDPGARAARERTLALPYRNPFQPRDLVIHPLTRYVADPPVGGPRVETHVELLDEFGHPVKVLGTLDFQLYRDAAGGQIAGEQLRRWEVDLSEPAANADAYDRVTRTYRVSLTGAPAIGGRPTALVLLAQFETLEGMVLTTEHRF